MRLLLDSFFISPMILILGLSFSVHAAETNTSPFIEVITSDAYPVSSIQMLEQQGISVKLYNLDDGKRLISTLGNGLPADQDAAKQVLEQRFKQRGNAAVKGQFMQAFEAVTVSSQYGLTRYPAVVFEHGQSVVYGVTDLSRALTLYRKWQVVP